MWSLIGTLPVAPKKMTPLFGFDDAVLPTQERSESLHLLLRKNARLILPNAEVLIPCSDVGGLEKVGDDAVLRVV